MNRNKINKAPIFLNFPKINDKTTFQINKTSTNNIKPIRIQTSINILNKNLRHRKIKTNPIGINKLKTQILEIILRKKSHRHKLNPINKIRSKNLRMSIFQLILTKNFLKQVQIIHSRN